MEKQSETNNNEVSKLSRRSFFRLLGGGVAAAVIAPKLLLDKIIEIPVEYGWTWYVDKTKIPGDHYNLSEIITKTLRKNSHLVADNVSKNNPLLMKLANKEKVQLNITKISPEEQTKRMTDRMELRQKEKDAKRLRDKINNGGRLYPVDYKADPFYEGYQDPVKKFAPDCYECQQKLEDIDPRYKEKPYGLSVPHIRVV